MLNRGKWADKEKSLKPLSYLSVMITAEQLTQQRLPDCVGSIPPPAKDKAVRINVKRCEQQDNWYAEQEALSSIYSI